MSTKDSARLTMDSCVGREREDQAVKRLFSRKDFLANIMKGTIAEYADLSIEEIMDCIEGDTIQTGTALVSEDAANTIRGENPLPTRKNGSIGQKSFLSYCIVFLRLFIKQSKHVLPVLLLDPRF